MLRLKSAEEDKIVKELDIDSSILYITYIHTSILPTIDELLDWRNRLGVLKYEEKFPGEWFDREIRATDYLLSKHNTQ
jgi:hypothetical protein